MDYCITHRERVSKALAHETPDRVPTDFLAEPQVWKNLQTHFCLENKEKVLESLDIDFREISYDFEPFCQSPQKMKEKIPDGFTTDIFGARRKPVKIQSAIHYQLCDYPLANANSIDKLKKYNWPEPDWWDFGRLNEVIDKINPHREYHLRFCMGSIFETAWSLRGFEQLLSDLILKPKLVGYILDRITEVHLENLKKVMKTATVKIDMLFICDDLAHQQGLMMSKDTWKNIIAPRQKKTFDLAKSYGKPLMYHCCGDIRMIVDELIDMGVDVLNPIRPSDWKMDFHSIKKAYGNRVTLHGAIDIQQLSKKGSPKFVAQEVEKAKKILGESGGYILAPAHHIQPDTPVENILALYEIEP